MHAILGKIVFLGMPMTLGLLSLPLVGHATECSFDIAQAARWAFEDRLNKEGYPAEALSHYSDGYAPVVRFNGTSVSQDTLKRRDQAVFASFPERVYHIEANTMAISCENGGTRVSAVVSWAFYYADHAPAQAGETRLSYMYDSNWKIIAIFQQALVRPPSPFIKQSPN